MSKAAYLTSSQLRDRFQVSVRTLWNLIDRSGFPEPVRFGPAPKSGKHDRRRRRWPVDAVEAWERARAARPDHE